MNISGLLELLDQVPAFEELVRQLTAEERSSRLLPLELARGSRAPVVANLYRAISQPRRSPIVLLTARVDAATMWQQALETWLPAGSHLLRFSEPTPLPYDRGPWSDRARQGRLGVLTGLIGGQHPLIPAPETPLLILSSMRAFLQKTLPKRRFVAATRVLRPGQVLDLEKTMSGWQQSVMNLAVSWNLPGNSAGGEGSSIYFPRPRTCRYASSFSATRSSPFAILIRPLSGRWVPPKNRDHRTISS